MVVTPELMIEVEHYKTLLEEAIRTATRRGMREHVNSLTSALMFLVKWLRLHRVTPQSFESWLQIMDDSHNAFYAYYLAMMADHDAVTMGVIEGAA